MSRLRLVELDPFDENAQTLLVRSLAASGDRAGAQERVRVCTDLFRRELGIEPSAGSAARGRGLPRHLDAWRPLAVDPPCEHSSKRATQPSPPARSRQGCSACAERWPRRRHAATTTCSLDRSSSLGSALVHAVRGRDLEGAAALHNALGVAERIDADTIVASACRELGFVDVQQGRHERAELWLERAETIARIDAAELARVNGIRGMALSDSARYPEAIATLQRSIDFARDADAAKQAAWSLSLLGRAHLLRGDYELATTALDESVDLVRAEAWTAFLPWPEALNAELQLLDGHVERAAEGFDHAFALACQIDDPCWQGLAGRGVGLIEVVRSVVDPRHRTAAGRTREVQRATRQLPMGRGLRHRRVVRDGRA